MVGIKCTLCKYLHNITSFWIFDWHIKLWNIQKRISVHLLWLDMDTQLVAMSQQSGLVCFFHVFNVHLSRHDFWHVLRIIDNRQRTAQNRDKSKHGRFLNFWKLCNSSWNTKMTWNNCEIERYLFTTQKWPTFQGHSVLQTRSYTN